MGTKSTENFKSIDENVPAGVIDINYYNKQQKENREVAKGMLIGPTLLAVSQFSGAFTICSYAAIVFQETGSTIDPNLSAIIMGSIQIVGTYLATLCIDNIGRKILLLVSTSGVTIGLAVTGAYVYLNKHGYDVSSFNWLPIASVSFVIFMSAIGLTPVPYVLINEIFPMKIRKIAATLCTCSVSIFSFTMLRIFPLLLENFSLFVCLSGFSMVGLFGILFIYFAVTESKGKNLDTIDIYNTKL